MRLLCGWLALVLSGVVAISFPDAARADTGGPALYYTDLSNGIWTAPAAHANQRTRLPKPHTKDGTPAFPEQAVPSRHDKRLAISMHLRRRAGQVLFVAGPHGQHPVQIARYDNDPDDLGTHWSISDLAWRGQHRLYFDLSDGTRTAIDTVWIPAHGKPGPVHEVPNSDGLTGLSVDPTHNRLAAASNTEASCVTPSPGARPTSTIVILNLATHHRRALTTVTSPDTSTQYNDCPVTGHLRWSPDGSTIAFTGLVHDRDHPARWTQVVETVATAAHHEHAVHVVSPRLGKFNVFSVAWQSAHSLWFDTAGPLYSIRIRHTKQATKPLRRTSRVSRGPMVEITFG